MSDTTANEPTPVREQTLEEAAIAYSQAKREMDTYPGPKKGPEFAALIATWRATLLELDAAAARTARRKPA